MTRSVLYCNVLGPIIFSMGVSGVSYLRVSGCFLYIYIAHLYYFITKTCVYFRKWFINSDSNINSNVLILLLVTSLFLAFNDTVPALKYTRGHLLFQYHKIQTTVKIIPAVPYTHSRFPPPLSSRCLYLSFSVGCVSYVTGALTLHDLHENNVQAMQSVVDLGRRLGRPIFTSLWSSRADRPSTRSGES